MATAQSITQALMTMHPSKLKEKIKDALRKTGHVSEEALEAVAETAVTVVIANAGGPITVND